MFRIQGVHFLFNIHLFTRRWSGPKGVDTDACREEGREQRRLRDGSGKKGDAGTPPVLEAFRLGKVIACFSFQFWSVSFSSQFETGHCEIIVTTDKANTTMGPGTPPFGEPASLHRTGWVTSSSR